MKLFVRYREGIWITFIHDVKEFKDFIDSYIPGRPFVIGDLSTFSSTMKNMLLKFIEENPTVNVYSSEDITDRILLSRFVEVVKEPLVVASATSIDEFLQSDRGYLSSKLYLGSLSNEAKLRAPLCSQNNLKLLLSDERSGY